MKPVRWGIIGVAKIATRKVIPAMQKSANTPVVAIASRDLAKAKQAAEELGIVKAYGSYEEMLADPDVDAVYNPLPNHLHVPLSIKAAEAGKHVLCEKPLSLTLDEVRQLIAARDRTKVCIGEAFMVHTHPQWIRTREVVQSGRIGEPRSASGFFSYFNNDPANVRNVPEWGGGGLMDVGCYPIHVSRFVFGEEPLRAIGVTENDPQFNVDRLTSAILEYPGGKQCIFTCSTQLVPYQRMQFFGTKGRVELNIPFNALPDHESTIFIDDGSDILGSGIKTEAFPICDQYTIQGDEFSKAVRGEGKVPVSLEDAFGNMAVIDAIFRSVKSGHWETPEKL